jgi:putative endonuclease
MSTSRSSRRRKSDAVTVGEGNQSRRARGAYGERRAAEWYVANGYEVLDRNWRDGRSGELDLVVRRDTCVVFSEVKARASADYGLPAEAVTPVKQARIRRLGAAWLRAHEEVSPKSIRFDVVAVLGTQLLVYEAAF